MRLPLETLLWRGLGRIRPLPVAMSSPFDSSVALERRPRDLLRARAAVAVEVMLRRAARRGTFSPPAASDAIKLLHDSSNDFERRTTTRILSPPLSEAFKQAASSFVPSIAVDARRLETALCIVLKSPSVEGLIPCSDCHLLTASSTCCLSIDFDPDELSKFRSPALTLMRFFTLELGGC
jgi:hypothetical protein